MFDHYKLLLLERKRKHKYNLLWAFYHNGQQCCPGLNLDRKRKVLSSNKMGIILITQSPIANSFVYIISVCWGSTVCQVILAVHIFVWIHVAPVCFLNEKSCQLSISAISSLKLLLVLRWYIKIEIKCAMVNSFFMIIWNFLLYKQQWEE